MDRARHGAATHTVVTVYQILQEALRGGISRGELRALTGFYPDELTDFAQRLPAARLFEVWETIMRRVNDPGFPLRVARNGFTDARSPVTYLAAACATVRDSIITAAESTTAWTTAYTLIAVERPGGISIVLDGLSPDRLGTRCEAEFQIADFLTGFHSEFGEDFTAPRVAFTHPAPSDTAEHRAYFGPGLVFDAMHTEILVPADILDLPVSTARPGLADALTDHIAGLRATHDVAPSYALQVREWLLRHFLSGKPSTVATAAKALAVSERTLHRRLAEEGTTFRSVCEATRRQLATDLVRSSPRAFKEIASLVGFADPRSFHRAYLRWTGTTPGRDRVSTATRQF
ncbi:AraC family transcriptional regulator [Actinocrispum wychmicini]|uniref:AraC-like DNA-binding protein n=1 Tax=Actinocrispum wychmicini TaxID=1213861 RepID=A0A4R2K8M6_9PSEU|nr:AraC family transcriptional regulator [Actinocrispum wychmicini]TCO62735.1 AraC-like DNA-binding protein [Actinocrispum wychmicini]